MFLVCKAATGIHLYICVSERARAEEPRVSEEDPRIARFSIFLSLSLSRPRTGEKKRKKKEENKSSGEKKCGFVDCAPPSRDGRMLVPGAAGVL